MVTSAFPDSMTTRDRRVYLTVHDPLAHSSMSLVRRSLGALAGLSLLQLTLLGSGTLCALRHGGANSDTGVHAMRGMAGMVAESPADCGSQHDGCGLPWAPGQCSSMTTCQMSANPAASGVASVTMRVVALDLPSAALIHSGPTFAPDLPPPRA